MHTIKEKYMTEEYSSPADTIPARCFGRWLDILTPSSYKQLPDGTVVVSIFGRGEFTKGIDYIDQDPRGGQIAFGLPVSPERAAQLTEQYGTP